MTAARGHTSRSLHEVENLSEDEPLCPFGKQVVSLFLLDVCQSQKIKLGLLRGGRVGGRNVPLQLAQKITV